MSLSDDCILGLARVLNALDVRSGRIERWIDAPITSPEEPAIRAACQRAGVQLGAYYRWYLVKWLLARRIRRLNQRATLRLIARADRTDYRPLDAALQSPKGLLIAVPHHGHYILSMTSIALRVSQQRPVYVFYGDPKTHAGNELFDALHARIWSDPESRVQIVHDTRAGMIKAMRGLQQGAAVLIMPDVYKELSDTYQLPFLGRPTDVMLGTAILARKTGTSVLPTVAVPLQRGFRFANRFGPVLAPSQHATAGTFDDYCLTAGLFEAFEGEMGPDAYHWQFARQHFQRTGNFPLLAPEDLDRLADVLQGSPGITGPLSAPLSVGRQKEQTLEPLAKSPEAAEFRADNGDKRGVERVLPLKA